MSTNYLPTQAVVTFVKVFMPLNQLAIFYVYAIIYLQSLKNIYD